MKNVLLNRVLKIALLSSFALSSAHASLPVAEVSKDDVTLQCHDSNDKGLASLVLNVKNTKHAYSPDFKTREVVLGDNISYYIFDQYVVNPKSFYKSASQVKTSYQVPFVGRESSGRLQNIAGKVFYSSENGDFTLTIIPLPNEKSDVEANLSLSEGEEAILAQVITTTNGTQNRVKMKCQTWDGN